MNQSKRFRIFKDLFALFKSDDFKDICHVEKQREGDVEIIVIRMLGPGETTKLLNRQAPYNWFKEKGSVDDAGNTGKHIDEGETLLGAGKTKKL